LGSLSLHVSSVSADPRPIEVPQASI